MTITATPVKFVLFATATPDECVKRAQVAILTDGTWHLIAPSPYRCHGNSSQFPMPEVACPVVDVSQVPAELDERMTAIMESCTDKQAGVINLSGLLSGLEALGAKIANRPFVQ